MRILLVTTESFLTGGAGIATYTQYAVRGHLDAGHSVHMLALSEDDKPAAPFVHPRFRLTHLAGSEIAEARRALACRNPGAAGQQLVTRRVRSILAEEKVDLIEGQDYLAPLHDLAMRRRFGHMPECPPIAVFGHGMLRIMSPDTAEFPTHANLREFTAEITCAEWADRVLSPSTAYTRQLSRQLRRMDHVRLVREPFLRASPLPPRGEGGVFCMLGRISFTKGPDRLAHFANSIRGRWPIERLLFVGAPRRSPFGDRNMGEDALRRLHPELRAKAEFTGSLPREEVIGLVESAHFHVNLSRFESYSYAQMETLMAGVAPVVMEGTAMAELLPPSAAPALLDPARFEAGDNLGALRFWSGSEGRARMEEAQAHAASITSPGAYIESYRAAVRDLVEGPPPTVVVMGNWRGEDVTVLLPTHNDAALLEGALDSVLSQDPAPRGAIVFDDGTSDPASLEALARIAARPGVVVRTSGNVGVVNARNELARMAGTEFVLFLDSDDRLAPGAMAAMLRTLNSDASLDAAIPQRRNFGQSAELVVDFPLGLPLHWVYNDFRMTSLLRREVMLKLRHPASMRWGEADDWHFWLRFSLHGHRAGPCPEPMFLYSFARGSLSWPWSEGQAALSATWRTGALEEAEAMGVDISAAARELLLAHAAAEHELHARTAEFSGLSPQLKELLDSRWLALGTLLGQAAPLRESLADPVANAGEIPRHVANSGWMRLGRRLGIRIDPRRKP